MATPQKLFKVTNVIHKILLIIFTLLTLSTKAHGACTTEIVIEGAIGPATLDYLQSGLEQAELAKCSSVLALINTPGGSLQSTRLIVEEILNSKVPVLCLVYPSGAHAGSAGAIILQACHVAGGINPTNIGAATPILSGGEEMGKDLRAKMVNDTVSWVEGLARLRGRNVQFAKDIIESAKSVDATRAAEIGAINFAVKTKEEFLQKSEGLETVIRNSEKSKVQVGELKSYLPSLKHKLLDMVTDPQFAYLIFMASLALIYFEVTHPGFGAPGVIGIIGLIVSLISFHKLDVWWGGLALVLLGVGLLILEIFVTSFGILGVGGIVAFTMGSLLLFDPVTGYSLPLITVLPTSIIVGLLMLGLGYLALQTRKVKKIGAYDDIIGAEAEVVTLNDDKRSGFVEIKGENWKFVSSSPIQLKQKVKIIGHEGMILKVMI